MKYVVIVAEGQWGLMKRTAGDYDAVEEDLARVVADRGGSATIAVDTKSALLAIAPATAKDTALVFTTRGMLSAAERVHREHPELGRVVVLTGLPDDLEHSPVVIVDKGLIAKDYDAYLDAILGEL